MRILGLIEGALGHATAADAAQAQEALGRLLMPAETVRQSYKLVRDLIVFTDKRLILIDRQGVTGSKTMYRSVPYPSITQFWVETAGTLGLESELKIWVTGQDAPYTQSFRRGEAIFDVQRQLAAGVLGASVG